MSALGIRGFVAKHWAWLALLAVLVVTSAVRVRLLDVPLERDEGEYAYTAQLLLDGHAPFEGAYSLKLPGAAYMYAASFLVFSESVMAIRLGLLVVSVATALLLFGIGKRLGGGLVGFSAAATYSLVALLPSVLGFTANTEAYAVLFIALAVYGLLRFHVAPHLGFLIVTGLSLGVAITMKQQALLFLLWAFGWASALVWKRTHAWFHLGTLVLCALIPTALIVVLSWASGTLQTLNFWILQYARAYTGEVSGLEALQNFFLTGGPILQQTLLFFALACIGVVFLIRQPRRTPYGWPILTFTVTACIVVSLGGYFRAHYFIFALPAYAVLVAFGVQTLHARLTRAHPASFAQAVTALLLAASLAFPFLYQRAYFFADSPVGAAQRAYSTNHFAEYREFARQLRERFPTFQTVVVLGSEPEFPFYLRARQVTGYLYTYPFFETQPYGERMLDEYIREVEAGQPEVILAVGSFESWSAHVWQTDNRLRAWFADFRHGYRAVGLLAVQGGAVQYSWGDVAEPDAQASDWVVAYQRINYANDTLPTP